MRKILVTTIISLLTLLTSQELSYAKLPASRTLLGREIRLVVQHAGLRHTVKAIEVYSRKNREILYHSNSQLLLNPASNLKIVTTSFTLDKLGKDFTFNTLFAAYGKWHDNALSGDLVIKASGDPIVSDVDLDSCAREIAAHHLNRIDGNILVDISSFDTLEWGTGWMWDDEPQAYAMFISPASVDHDAISAEIGVNPVTHKLFIFLQPNTRFVKTISYAVPGTIDSLVVTRVMDNDTNTVVVQGTFTQELTDTVYQFSVRRPAMYFGSLLKEALERNGVKVLGQVTTTRNPISTDSLQSLFELTQSIDTVVTYVNKVSDNLGAECLLRDVAHIVKGGAGSAESGIKLEKLYLRSCGVDSSEYVIVDGSGVSRYDVITPSALVKVLNHVLSGPEGKVFFRSLPVAGYDGTLQDRMRQRFIAGKVHAKTGSLSGVSTLSGYVVIPGDTLVFSMMMQNYPARIDSSISALQNEICRILALYSGNVRAFRHNLWVNRVGTYGPEYRRRSIQH